MALQDVLNHVGCERLPAAVLWDMDGTIVDSEEEWAEITRQIVLAKGGEWNDDDDAFIRGANTQDHGGRMADAVERAVGTRPDPSQLFRELGERMKTDVYGAATLIEGARELLLAFREAGIAQAMVTATPKDIVDVALEALGENYFNAVVTGSEDVPGKPDPGPYLLGAKRLAAEPTECLAFEDSRAGLAAARASGAHVVDVNEYRLADLAKLL
ncbi:HAD superfamily hydrolase (TIGR01509 family) [Trueperella bonasi]|uniref:HAD superfamily hydrolase (TIGR01509 family) n=1 Tax=Trueperella bonasi TaxID=312286 RepID=A0ABT9NEX6_9ACTO|nr:HAD family phosphatase [Trueperella bonasi]MDP9805927.1 HAD superfamily hydrolase (TIGR01509 family) [Trueperella bonasi]